MTSTLLSCVHTRESNGEPPSATRQAGSLTIIQRNGPGPYQTGPWPVIQEVHKAQVVCIGTVCPQTNDAQMVIRPQNTRELTYFTYVPLLASPSHGWTRIPRCRVPSPLRGQRLQIQVLATVSPHFPLLPFLPWKHSFPSGLQAHPRPSSASFPALHQVRHLLHPSKSLL